MLICFRRKMKCIKQSFMLRDIKEKRDTWLGYFVVGTAAMACYANALSGEFVHDDIPAIVLNRDVQTTQPMFEVFRDDFWGTPLAELGSHKSYRPLTTLTFRINNLLFGMNPVWFHLTNLLLHVTTCILFTKTCWEVGHLEAPFATICGLLFAVHPVHTEAVTGIVGRADVLAGLLFLVALLMYNKLKFTSGSVQFQWWGYIFFGGLGMLAKETGITVFIVNFLWDFYKSYWMLKNNFLDVRWSQSSKTFLKRSFYNLCAFGVLFGFRLSMLQGSLPIFSEQDNPAAFHLSLLVRTMTFCYLSAFNCWLLLCPTTLSHDWQMGSIPLVTSLDDSRNLLTCFWLALLLLIIVRSFLDFENQENASIILGLLMLTLPFLPATNLFVTVGFVVAERILYIPSMGSILLIVTGFRRLWRLFQHHRQTIFFCLLLLLMSQALRCVVRNRDWCSRESLLRSGIATLPQNAKMHYNYGNFLKDSGRYELAIAHYYTALRLWPTYASAHNNLGTLLKDSQEAEKHFKLAIRYSANHLNAHYNLGKMYRTSNMTKSNEMFQRCLAIDVRFKPAFIELCQLQSNFLLGASQKNCQIERYLQKIVALNQQDYEYHRYFALRLKKQGNFRKSFKYFIKVSRKLSIALIDSMKILRSIGNQSRVFQLITRFQRILRLQSGEILINTNSFVKIKIRL